MKIEIIPILRDNYAYLVVCEESDQVVAVDPGDGAPIAARLEELVRDRPTLKFTAIWNTHHHWDHISGNDTLAARDANIELYAPRQPEGGATEGSAPRGRANKTVRVGDQSSFRLGSRTVRIIAMPGHTLDSVAYLVDDALFCGDALFGCGCGRLFEGSPEVAYHSLNQRLVDVADETRIFCGHEYTETNIAFALSLEPQNEALKRRASRVGALRQAGKPSIPSTLAEERQTNPFLRCDQPALKRAVIARGEGGVADLDDPAVLFAALRRLRDKWPAA